MGTGRLMKVGVGGLQRKRFPVRWHLTSELIILGKTDKRIASNGLIQAGPTVPFPVLYAIMLGTADRLLSHL